MNDPEQLAICKERGHQPEGRGIKWERCKYCGMWTRTVSTIEEREDDPPEEEQDPMYKLDRINRETLKLLRNNKAK